MMEKDLASGVASLDPYRRKRAFDQTPEPAGGEAVESRRRFVVQKHAASRLHYDLRLEMEGVLRSRAVPKGPSLSPTEKRLAVHVEDHPVDYVDFEVVIPKGQYGGGTVMLWDRGSYQAEGDGVQAYRRGDLKFELQGERLHGQWVLARAGGKAADGGKNWLLIKKRDGYVLPKREAAAWLEAQDLSVMSGRTMRQIVEAPDAAASGSASQADVADPPQDPGDTPSAGLAAINGARGMPLADTYRPQLAKLGQATPRGGGWVHEIKFDGYRLILLKQADAVRVLTRNQQDWTDRFPRLAEAVGKLKVEVAVLDGEAVVLDEQGVSRFGLLQKALSRAGKSGRGGLIRYYAFDLLYLDGYDLRQCPLLTRKQLLQRLIEQADSHQLLYSEHIAGSGPAFHGQACGHDLGGIISKRRDAVYELGPRRSGSWIKSKCVRRQEFIIVGYTKPSGSRTGFGALLLASHADERLIYCGRVGTGFDEATLDELSGQQRERERDEPPVAGEVPRRERREAHWVRPELVAEVEFAEWTDDRMLRQARFVGLREDKPAEQVAIELPEDEARPAEAAAEADTAEPANEAPPDEVRLTNPDRVLYPEAGLTKRRLADFYADIAEWVLPHVANRPLALLRCPGGRQKQCFYQKHLGDSAPDALGEVEIGLEGKARRYAVVKDLAGLLSLVQLGVLEIHPWGSLADDPERPDRLFLDLDPGPDVAWPDVIAAADLVREALEHLGLQSFCKLTGGKGLHVIVPLTPAASLDWTRLKALAKALASRVAAADPDAYTINMSKTRRRGKVFLDYLRNGRGQTAVAAYSTRARANAPVAAPIRWDKLKPSLEPSRYTVNNLRRRLASLRGDPWRGFFSVQQSITPKMQRAVGLQV